MIRNNKSELWFDYVGVVKSVDIQSERTNISPATYRLKINKFDTPIRIHREAGDKFTHDTVLRKLGFPPVKGNLPHGIYRK